MVRLMLTTILIRDDDDEDEEDCLFCFCSLWVCLFSMLFLVIDVTEFVSFSMFFCIGGGIDDVDMVADPSSISEVLAGSLGTSLLTNELGCFPCSCCRSPCYSLGRCRSVLRALASCT